jgi:hypothetical protein
MAKCTLLALHCYLSDESDKDEVFIKSNGKKIWPEDSKYIKADQEKIQIGTSLEFNDGEEVILELWDYDFLSPNDRLGEFKFKLLEKGGPYRTDLSREKDSNARYSLEWEYY